MQKIIDLSTVSSAIGKNSQGITQFLILNGKVYDDLRPQLDKPFSDAGLKRIIMDDGRVLAIDKETKIFVYKT